MDIGGDIMLKVNKGTNSFYIGDTEESPLAEITFNIADGNVIVADHTLISDELSGQGVGKLLLKELVSWARSEYKMIKPVCPFIKAQMEKNSEYHDMIFKEI